MRGLLLDLRIALRRLRRRPLATAVIVLTLGLAVAGVAAVASAVWGMLLRPLDLEEPERLVRVREDWGAPGAEPVLRSVNPATVRLWRQRAPVLEDVAAAHYLPLALWRDGLPEQVDGSEVTANFFDLLGVEPVLGRGFTAGDAADAAEPVVLLGNGLWQRRFGGDRGIVGRELRVGDAVRTVVGVLPPGFAHPYTAEVWVPMSLAPGAEERLGNVLYVPARLAPGVDVERAQRELSAATLAARADYPLPEGPHGATLVPLREELSRNLDTLLLPLFGAALLVLVIAAANVAGLLVAQAAEQRRDLAVRAVLGAGGWQLRPFLLQGLLLASAGGVAGVVLAAAILRPLVELSPLAGIALSELGPKVALEGPVLLFVLAAVLGVGFGLGLVPALAAARRQPREMLQKEERGARAGLRVLSLLVAGEFALAALLTLGAALVVDGFERMRRAESGFDPHGLLVVDLAFPGGSSPEEPDAATPRSLFLRQAIERIEAIPAVSAAAATTVQPLWTGVFSRPFDLTEEPAPDPPGYYSTHHRLVTPDYLETMGIGLVAGRSFHEGEGREGDVSPVIVSRSLAERFWSVESAVGKRLRAGRLDSAEPWLTVVGVAEDLAVETADAYLNLNDVRFTWYLPIDYEPLERASLVVRTGGDPAAVTPAVRRALAEVDPQQPVSRVASMDERLAELHQRDRFAALLGALLALLGTVLAAAGLYALVAYRTALSRRDHGVRLALGARPRQIQALVLRRTLVLCAAGTAAGLALSLLTLRTLQSLVPGVDPARPLVWAAVVVGFALVALAAAWGPARQVRRLEPSHLLRST